MNVPVIQSLMEGGKRVYCLNFYAGIGDLPTLDRVKRVRYRISYNGIFCVANIKSERIELMQITNGELETVKPSPTYTLKTDLKKVLIGTSEFLTALEQAERSVLDDINKWVGIIDFKV